MSTHSTLAPLNLRALQSLALKARTHSPHVRAKAIARVARNLPRAAGVGDSGATALAESLRTGSVREGICLRR